MTVYFNQDPSTTTNCTMKCLVSQQNLWYYPIKVMTTYSIFFFSHLSNEEYMIYLIPCRPRGLYNFRPISYAECSETQLRIICEKMKNTKQGKRIVLPVGWQLLCKEKKRSYMLESNWRITIRIRFVSCYEHKDIEGSLIPWTVIRFHFFFSNFSMHRN